MRLRRGQIRFKSKLAIAGAVALALPLKSKGQQIIAAYNFGASSTSFTYAATTLAANVTASGINSTNDFGVDDFFSQDDGQGGVSGWYSNNPGGNYLSVYSIASSFDNGFWVESIVTAAAGYEINPTSFELYGGAGGSSAVRSCYIYDNVDGYPTSIAPNASGAPTITGNQPLASGDFTVVRGTGGTPAMNEVQVSSFPSDDIDLSTFTVRVYFDTQGNVNKNIDLGRLELDGLVVALPVTLTWNNAGGSGDGMSWNTTSQNWNNGTGLATYSDGDTVIFNDANETNYAVTLNTTVSPASVTVNNSAQNYTIGGTGSIAGTASLTKSGTSNLILNTVNTYNGGTNVSAGTLVVGVNGALPSGAVNITGGTVQLAASTGLATITSLSISGTGTFDVNNNHVIINYGSPANDPIASIQSLLATGYNGGAWNGAGGIVSTAAAANSANYGLGYADSADPGNPAGLASGTIEIKYTLLGDVNLDGVVNGTDFGILAANFNKGVTGWDKGDFVYANIVNATDFGDLAKNFNKGASGASIGEPAYDDPAILAFAAANGLLADVPEPASVGLIVVPAIAMLLRRRRASHPEIESFPNPSPRFTSFTLSREERL